ncbi:MAG: hypothetical protein V4727_10925 [Verrucomicrobiota bacterium]
MKHIYILIFVLITASCCQKITVYVTNDSGLPVVGAKPIPTSIIYSPTSDNKGKIKMCANSATGIMADGYISFLKRQDGSHSSLIDGERITLHKK